MGIWLGALNYAICAVVWMGFDKTDGEHCLPKADSGGTYPAKLLKTVIHAYYEDRTAPHYTVPDGVEKLRLDKTALLNGDVRIAASYLLSGDVLEEYLYIDMAAEIQNKDKALQCLVYDLCVELNGSGEPVISFRSSSNIALYEIWRISEGDAQQVIATLPGDLSLSCVDHDAKFNKGYTYSVQPVDENGHALGQRSEQVYIYVAEPLR